MLGDIVAEGMGKPLSRQVILRVAFYLQMLGCLVLEISLQQPRRGFISLWLEKFSLADARPCLQDDGNTRLPHIVAPGMQILVVADLAELDGETDVIHSFKTWS